MPIYDAPNAVEELKQPTAEKVEAIKDALKHVGIISYEKMRGGRGFDDAKSR